MEDNLMKLYDISFPTFSTAERAASLYRQGNYRLENGIVKISPKNSLDLGTYFNAFSIKKWMTLTYLNRLGISLEFLGEFSVEIYGFKRRFEIKYDREEDEVKETYGKGKQAVMQNFEEEIFFAADATNGFAHEFNFDELATFAEKVDMLGMRLTAKNETGTFLGGAYFGEFSKKREVKIGITICTFKREKYLLPNLEKLKILTDSNPNYSVMVIDNGRTIEEKNSASLQIMHNRNFGGSGGFTRGLMEQVSQNKNTHAILMDDDIVIELAALDRLYSFLVGLKEDYHENFFAGAMLRLAAPILQGENTSKWNGRGVTLFGNNFDLSYKYFLCKNEKNPSDANTYAGWWFCCMPLVTVKKIGYPLPNFIKGDDMEYGIRQGKDFLTMNGVGVWHEDFEQKFNPVMKYFHYRNMYIMQHFGRPASKFQFLREFLRDVKACVRFMDGHSMRMMERALRDLEGGYEGITSVPADEKFQQMRNYPLTKNAYVLLFVSLYLGFKHFLNYDEHDAKLKNFVKEKLSDQKFWRQFLGLTDK